MFTYIDPTIRERLTAQGSLFQVDRDGVRFAPDVAAPGGHTISVLGPIPLPFFPSPAIPNATSTTKAPMIANAG